MFRKTTPKPKTEPKKPISFKFGGLGKGKRKKKKEKEKDDAAAKNGFPTHHETPDSDYDDSHVPVDEDSEGVQVYVDGDDDKTDQNLDNRDPPESFSVANSSPMNPTVQESVKEQVQDPVIPSSKSVLTEEERRARARKAVEQRKAERRRKNRARQDVQGQTLPPETTSVEPEKEKVPPVRERLKRAMEEEERLYKEKERQRVIEEERLQKEKELQVQQEEEDELRRMEAALEKEAEDAKNEAKLASELDKSQNEKVQISEVIVESVDIRELEEEEEEGRVNFERAKEERKRGLEEEFNDDEMTKKEAHVHFKEAEEDVPFKEAEEDANLANLIDQFITPDEKVDTEEDEVPHVGDVSHDSGPEDDFDAFLDDVFNAPSPPKKMANNVSSDVPPPPEKKANKASSDAPPPPEKKANDVSTKTKKSSSRTRLNSKSKGLLPRSANKPKSASRPVAKTADRAPNRVGKPIIRPPTIVRKSASRPSNSVEKPATRPPKLVGKPANRPSKRVDKPGIRPPKLATANRPSKRVDKPAIRPPKLAGKPENPPLKKTDPSRKSNRNAPGKKTPPRSPRQNNVTIENMPRDDGKKGGWKTVPESQRLNPVFTSYFKMNAETRSMGTSGTFGSECTISSIPKPPNYFGRPAGMPICNNIFIPSFHALGPCQVCLFRLSESEMTEFEKNGRHLRVAMTRGGVLGCKIFPSLPGQDPVRLCKQCYFDTHSTPTKKDEAFTGIGALGGIQKERSKYAANRGRYKGGRY